MDDLDVLVRELDRAALLLQRHLAPPVLRHRNRTLMQMSSYNLEANSHLFVGLRRQEAPKMCSGNKSATTGLDGLVVCVTA